MKVKYAGPDYDSGEYEVIRHCDDIGAWLCKGKLFDGHEILLDDKYVIDDDLGLPHTPVHDDRTKMTGVHPIQGETSVHNLSYQNDEKRRAVALLFDVGAYPVRRHGWWGFSDNNAPEDEILAAHGKVKDCWTILENWDTHSPVSMTICSVWIEYEDGTIAFYPSEEFNASQLDHMPKAAYDGFEEVSLF